MEPQLKIAVYSTDLIKRLEELKKDLEKIQIDIDELKKLDVVPDDSKIIKLEDKPND